MAVNNQIEFNNILRLQLEKCVRYISEKILECVKSHIIKDVYLYDYFPNKVYANNGVPTFEFMDAFEFEGVKSTAKEISNKLFYNWMEMSPPSLKNPYVHGNVYTGEDRRSILAEILNVKGVDSGNDFGGKKRNAFWDEAIKEIDEKFDSWAKACYNLYLR